MKPEQWQQIAERFEAALELPANERSGYVIASCGDEVLRDEVLSLLEAHDLAEQQTRDSNPRSTVSLEPTLMDQRTMFGSYEPVQEIGRSRISIVYLARRTDGEYPQQAAVKILQASFNDQISSRFRREKRILAALVHPNISRLYDSGVTEDGDPYLVMEYLEGQPLDAYCASADLSIRARLRLFRDVCMAVAYAHRHLVIHRDLKPSNILVLEDGTPKLLDFGIAKLLGADSDDTDFPTVAGWQPMTPQFASPEQVNDRRVSTASDVYSLGMILYLLLAECLPYRVSKLSREQHEGFLSGSEPLPAPSQAVLAMDDSLAQWSARQRTERSKQLLGDLDSLVLGALQPDPEARYPSAEAMISDLDRYFAGRPLLAHRSTWTYRAKKFFQRHRLSLSLSALIVCLLAGSAVRSSLQAQRVARERDRSESLVSFLVDLFETSPADGVLSATTLRSALDEGARRVEAERSKAPESRAAMFDTLGVLYSVIGEADDAERMVSAGLDLRAQHLDEMHPERGESLLHLGTVRYRQGDYSSSESRYREALEVFRRLGRRSPQLAEAQRALAIVRFEQGDFDEAEELLRAALSFWQSRSGFDARRQQGHALSDLGAVLLQTGNLEAADQRLQEALAIRKDLYAEDHPDLAATLDDLGRLASRRGDFSEAEDLLQQALQSWRSFHGDLHPRVVEGLSQLGVVQHRAGRLLEAEATSTDAVELSRQVFGEAHPAFATALNNLAVVTSHRGNLAAAEMLLRQGLTIRRQVLGEEHPYVAQSRNTLGQTLQLLGKSAEAETLLRRADQDCERLLPPGHQARAYPKINLGRVLVDLDRASEAEPLLRRGLELLRATQPPGSWRIASAESALGSCLAALGRDEEAAPLLQRGYAGLESRFGADHPLTLWTGAWLQQSPTPPKQSRTQAINSRPQTLRHELFPAQAAWQSAASSWQNSSQICVRLTFAPSAAFQSLVVGNSIVASAGFCTSASILASTNSAPCVTSAAGFALATKPKNNVQRTDSAMRLFFMSCS